MKTEQNPLFEICANCGFTYGSHRATKVDHYNKLLGKFIKKDQCPATERGMDWDDGPGTSFNPTGTYREKA